MSGANSRGNEATTGAARLAAGLGALFVSLVVVAMLAKALYPVDLPPNPSPDFVDTIFDNRSVIWAARLLLVSTAAVLAFGGIFIVLSIGIRIRKGHWLSKAGPFEISEESRKRSKARPISGARQRLRGRVSCRS